MFSMRFREARGGFFDRAGVLKAVDAAGRRNLSRFGAFVRTRARSSIRKRKKVSEVGAPPSSHVDTLKKLIFFSYDFARRSVVTGPTRSGTGEAPRLLEEGGEVTHGGRTLHYRGRPYMGPAFREEQKRIPALWRDSVRR